MPPASPWGRPSFFVVCQAAKQPLKFRHFGESLRGEDALIWVAQAVSPTLAKMPEYRRRLPHFHPDDTCLFLTWRLWGSLPARAKRAVYPTAGYAFVATDRELDTRASGPLWLKDPRIADLVARTILAGDCERHFYDLCAWAVMPNHVHLLILPKVPVPVLTRWMRVPRPEMPTGFWAAPDSRSGRMSHMIITCAIETK